MMGLLLSVRPGKIGPGPINPPEPGGKIWVWVRDFRTRQKTGQPEPDPFKNGLGLVDPRVMWVDPFCRFFFFLFFLLFFSASTTPATLQLHSTSTTPATLQLHFASTTPATSFCKVLFLLLFFFFKGALEQPYRYQYINITYSYSLQY